MLVEVLESEIHDTGSAYACVKKSLLQAVVAELTAKVNGDTSDGYHTFNELYHHRAVLFSVICNTYRDRAWKSLQHHDPSQPMYNGMFIVGIETPEGQATYHYDIDPYWDMFDVRVLDRAPEWDGHTPDEAIRRIGTITPDLVRPHAYWIDDVSEDRQPRSHFRCSNCGKVFGRNAMTMNFCQYCGASMDMSPPTMTANCNADYCDI